MASPLTCSINLFVATSKIFSNPNLLSSLFLRKSSIYAFLSLAHISSRFALKIPRLCSAAYPHPSIRFVFRSSIRISSFLPFKDRIPKFLRSGVVYLFKCRYCSASYVGQTTRHLHTLVSEHLGIFPITGKPSSSPVTSSIFSHLKTTGHTANFEIPSSCSDDRELMIHESLLISKFKLTLNVQGSSIPLNLF